MLAQLKIVNYAIIDHLDIPFHKGMTAITGETGAGKSIILGALGLALGERVDTSVLKNNQEKCIIEATFDLKNISLTSFFQKHELDYEPQTILRREISAQGKSRAFVNDTPVSLNVLKELSENLIDVHSQHQTLLLNKEQFQLGVIDTFAKNEKEKKEYEQQYKSYNALQQKFQKLKEDELKLKSDVEFFEFQLKELREVPLDEINEEELLKQLDDLNNAEDIKASAIAINEGLEGDSGVLTILYALQQEVERGGGTKNDRIKELVERIKTLVIEAKDIAEEATDIEGDIVFDDELSIKIAEQVNQLKSLHKKHFTTEIGELIAIRDELDEKVSFAKSYDTELVKLENELVKQEKELNKLAQNLTKTRQAVSGAIAQEVERLLAELSMGDATFVIEIEPLQQYTKDGKDKVTFAFSANKGMPTNSIDKVASGGELSRLMLCIKKVLAESKNLPTIIFDEIDTGVSGEVAFKMGELMKAIANSTQVFAITHLPQIATKGQQHYFVYKKEAEGRTVTKMKLLTHDERIRATASMLSGSQVTDEAIKNAERLLG